MIKHMKQYNKQLLEAINRGIKLALDDFEDDNMSMVKHDIIKSESPIANIIDFKKSYVDFNLPSGTLWCKYNLGALKPEDAGNYYAWGETAPKEKYNPETYNYHVFTKYCGIKNIPELLPEDDAATYYDYRLKTPSKAQFNELLNYTDRKWVDNYNYTNVSGFIFTKNEQEIFIPCDGYIDKATFRGDSKPFLPDSIGRYWTSTLEGDNIDPSVLWFTGWHTINLDQCESCYNGLPIRPVIIKEKLKPYEIQ